MGLWIATKTLEAIDNAICSDGGNAFRKFQGDVLPHIGDAYAQDDGAQRTHMGASIIGEECERSIMFGWRWASQKKPRGKKGENPARAESRMRRLWNRGHLEEGRFIALMLMIKVAIYQQDENGKQYRISAHGGHFSGSGDGIGIGIPDLPPGVPCLTEYKTHSDDSFDKLVKDGVKKAKFQHYVQMQEYMHHMGLLYAIYFAVNKNTEALHAEIIMYDRPIAEHFLERARKLIFANELPPRIRGGSPGFHVCKYLCDHNEVCYHTVEPERNCRTCEFAFPMPDGTWHCVSPLVADEAAIAGWEDEIVLSKEAQIAGCNHYTVNKFFK